jgi:hypothetical protein
MGRVCLGLGGGVGYHRCVVLTCGARPPHTHACTQTLSLLCSTLAWQQRQGSVNGGGGAGMQLKYEDDGAASSASSALSAAAASGGANGGLLYPRVQGGGGAMGGGGGAVGGGGGGKPVIVYASRTHAQLSQVRSQQGGRVQQPVVLSFCVGCVCVRVCAASPTSSTSNPI